MLRSKAFTKITKKGAVVKIVKEHYLRDDIPCGLRGCSAGCNDSIKIDPSDDRTGPLVLMLDPFLGKLATQESSVLTAPHTLIPDTNIFLHHMDVMETPLFTDVVVLQTVLEEVRNRSPSIYQRIRNLVSQPQKRFFVFSNEHHRDCFAGDKQAAAEMESDNDRNDRAIRLATSWYNKHMLEAYRQECSRTELPCPTAILVTNDAGNRSRALEEGLRAYDIRSFVALIPLELGRHALQDMLDSVPPETEGQGGKSPAISYPEHLSEVALKEGVASGRYLRGTLQTSSFNPFKGTISTGLDGELSTVLIPDRIHLNRAIQGDSVVVEVLDRSRWLMDQDVAVNEDNEGEEPKSETAEDSSIPLGEETTINSGAAVRPVGRILGILNRKYRTYVGSIDRAAVRPEMAQQTLLFFPMDRKIPRIRLRTRQAAQLVGKRILVAIDEWDRSSKNPSGHFVRELGLAGDRATEISAILLEHDVNTAPFTPAQLAELPREDASWQVREEHLVGRADFRALPVCSIDPPGCTDIDDALHARRLADSNLVEVGVHIADVTFFVPPGGALDREASTRATTVYLVDRRIDMLPALLGSNLCSLQGGVERLSFSVIWQMDPETAEIKSVHFTRSVIKSCSAFTYDQAQERLDHPENFKNDKNVLESILLLAGLARRLKAKRIAAGALTLASPEVRFDLDTTTANPVDVQVKEMKEANSLVEEFMLLANISVAERLLLAFPDTALLRRHPAPPEEAFAGLKKALAPYDLTLDCHSSRSLADSLDRAVVSGDDFFNRLVRIMTTRCMYQAQYFAAGTLDRSAFWHYGLACPLYTHFTSPIRRYADVLVHRLLGQAIGAVGAASVGLAADKNILSDVCDNLNYRNRMAQHAQRASIDLFTCLYFKGRQITEDAYVIRIIKSGLVVLVPKYGMECVVPISDASLLLDQERPAFVRKNDSGFTVVHQLFQHLQIRLTVQSHDASLQDKLVVSLVTDEAELSAGTKRKLEN